MNGTYPPWEWKIIEWQGNKLTTVFEGLRGRKPYRRITYDETGRILEEIAGRQNWGRFRSGSSKSGCECSEDRSELVTAWVQVLRFAIE
jgi:hypothetical protein